MLFSFLSAPKTSAYIFPLREIYIEMRQESESRSYYLLLLYCFRQAVFLSKMLREWRCPESIIIIVARCSRGLSPPPPRAKLAIFPWDAFSRDARRDIIHYTYYCFSCRDATIHYILVSFFFSFSEYYYIFTFMTYMPFFMSFSFSFDSFFLFISSHAHPYILFLKLLLLYPFFFHIIHEHICFLYSFRLCHILYFPPLFSYILSFSLNIKETTHHAFSRCYFQRWCEQQTIMLHARLKSACYFSSYEVHFIYMKSRRHSCRHRLFCGVWAAAFGGARRALFIIPRVPAKRRCAPYINVDERDEKAECLFRFFERYWRYMAMSLWRDAPSTEHIFIDEMMTYFWREKSVFLYIHIYIYLRKRYSFRETLLPPFSDMRAARRVRDRKNFQPTVWGVDAR